MSATPEEKALIKAALRWDRDFGTDADRELRRAIQAVRISRRPLEGPDPIPCSIKAPHSNSMICLLPREHEGSELPDDRLYGETVHQGLAADGSRRRFRVWVDHRQPVT